MKIQMKHDGTYLEGCHGLHAVEEPDAVSALCTRENGYSGRDTDSVTKQPLRDDLVLEARAKELGYFNTKGVWLKRPLGETKATTGREPISVRCVDINK